MDILSTFPDPKPEDIGTIYMTVFDNVFSKQEPYGSIQIYMTRFRGDPPVCIKAPHGYEDNFLGLNLNEFIELATKLGWRCSKPTQLVLDCNNDYLMKPF